MNETQANNWQKAALYSITLSIEGLPQPLSKGGQILRQQLIQQSEIVIAKINERINRQLIKQSFCAIYGDNPQTTECLEAAEKVLEASIFCQMEMFRLNCLNAALKISVYNTEHQACKN